MIHVLTTASADQPAHPCPTGVSATIPPDLAARLGMSERHPCAGNHARGEAHRSAEGLEWDADASELLPPPPVTFTIGYEADPPVDLARPDLRDMSATLAILGLDPLEPDGDGGSVAETYAEAPRLFRREAIEALADLTREGRARSGERRSPRVTAGDE